MAQKPETRLSLLVWRSEGTWVAGAVEGKAIPTAPRYRQNRPRRPGAGMPLCRNAPMPDRNRTVGVEAGKSATRSDAIVIPLQSSAGRIAATLSARPCSVSEVIRPFPSSRK